MGIRLRDGEKVLRRAPIHWSSYSGTMVLGLFTLGILLLWLLADRPEQDREAMFWVMLFFGGLWAAMAGKTWLQNKFKIYIVTNQRLYIEKGMLARFKTDIPLAKINDISLRQTLMQRILGSGNLVVLTGNDVGATISDIDEPEDFKDTLSQAISQGSWR